MTIKQMDDGTWKVNYSKRHPITRVTYSLRRKGIKSKAEAIRVERELIIAIEKKMHKLVVPTWQQCVEEYMNYARNNGICESTLSVYLKCLLAHTIPLWGERCIDSITQDEVRILVQDPTKDWSASHRKNMLKYIRSICNYALEKQYINRVPIPNIRFKIVAKLKGGLTEEQAKLLLKTAQDLNYEWYPHWALALFTGMRTGELFALRWECVNFDDGIIFVKQAWNSKDGFKSPKNWEERSVPIAPDLLSLLKRLKLKTFDTGFVLPRISDWDKGEQAKVLRTFLAGMGLPPMRFHDLRASWATMLLVKGVEPIKVMAVGGWKDLKTMQKYIRLAGVDIKGVTNVLNLNTELRDSGKLLQLK